MTASRQCISKPITTPISRLAALAIMRQSQPDTLSCRQLAEIFRLNGYLRRNGVPADVLRTIARTYARRVDELGPEEFDRRMDLEAGR